MFSLKYAVFKPATTTKSFKVDPLKKKKKHILMSLKADTVGNDIFIVSVILLMFCVLHLFVYVAIVVVVVVLVRVWCKR